MYMYYNITPEIALGKNHYMHYVQKYNFKSTFKKIKSHVIFCIWSNQISEIVETAQFVQFSDDNALIA